MLGANIQACYLLNYSIKIKLETDEGNGRNKIWTLNKRRNSISCTKLALSVSLTHGMMAGGLNSWPDMYIYLPNWPLYIISVYIIYYIYYILYIYIYIFIKNAKMSVRLSFYWSKALVWYLSHHSCILGKLFEEASDLKLSKNVKAMFIFKIKLVC